MVKKVYLDYAATTFVSNEVLNEMMPCFNTLYGNASSIHSFGRDAAAIIDRARDRVAAAINAKNSNEIYFTSSGSEANNMAIKGIAHAYANKGKHIITSKIEHQSVLEACESLKAEGFEITYLPVDKNGLVSIAELLHAVRKDTILISIMAVNNEVGTIQNVKTIAKIAHENGIFFHTDAVQALGAIRLDVQDMEIDALSISAHKIYGPKGCGALYLKNGIKIEPLISGGNQERGKRGGTQDTASIAGFGKACEIAIRDMIPNQQKLRVIRHYFLDKVQENIEYIHINGDPHQKINGTVSISFEMVEGESLLMLLDLDGVAVSTSSACTSNALQPSHVLKAMGIEDELAQSTVRFSFGKNTSKADIDYAVERLVVAVKKLRSISPITKAGRR